MEQKEFSERLCSLRIQKGVSARDMSLSIGQSPSYINNIESGIGFPSMSVFFYICEFLGVTPAEFFDLNQKSPAKSKELMNTIRKLDEKQLDLIIRIAENFR